jgi:ribonucleoside-diphosphate reductase alpha chain
VNTDEDIKKVIPVAMRILDNVIDLNFYPIKEAEVTAKKYRSV